MESVVRSRTASQPHWRLPPLLPLSRAPSRRLVSKTTAARRSTAAQVQQHDGEAGRKADIVRAKGAVCNHQPWRCCEWLPSVRSQSPLPPLHAAPYRGSSTLGARSTSRSSGLGAQARSKLTRMATPTPLVTCGGEIDADTIRVPEVGSRFDALVLKTSPNMLSLGKRVIEEGRSFRWEAGSLPVLLSPSGDAIAVALKHNIPMLNSAHACPVVEPAGGALVQEPEGAECIARGNPQPKGPATRRRRLRTPHPSPPGKSSLPCLPAGEGPKALM